MIYVLLLVSIGFLMGYYTFMLGNVVMLRRRLKKVKNERTL